MQKLGVFATQVEIHALYTFLQVPVFIYSKITSSTQWQWIMYKPNNILHYNEFHSNLPLQHSPNYHIELCHTNSNHFDRVVQLSNMLSEQLSYSHSYPQLLGHDDTHNVIHCDWTLLLNVRVVTLEYAISLQQTFNDKDQSRGSHYQ